VVGLQHQRSSLEVEAVEDHPDPAVGNPQATAWEEDTEAAAGNQARRSLLTQVVAEVAHLNAAVGDPVVGLQKGRQSLEVEVVGDPLDAAVGDPVVHLQDQSSSLEVEAVEDHLDPAVGDPQATAWKDDTAAAVGNQARRSLLAQAVEELAHLNAAVGDPVVGLQKGR